MFIIIFLQISVYCETFFKNDYFTNFIVWAQINWVTCGNTYKKGGQRKKDATIIDNIIEPFDVSCFWIIIGLLVFLDRYRFWIFS
jgi:hypothetical protein